MLRHVLIHDNTDGVVEKTFAEDDRVEFGVDLVLLKNGKDGHRVRSRQSRTEYQAFQ